MTRLGWDVTVVTVSIVPWGIPSEVVGVFPMIIVVIIPVVSFTRMSGEIALMGTRVGEGTSW